MRLTKTQVRLLTDAAASRVGRCYTILIGGHGGAGGILRGGARDSTAARKLRDAGLLRFVSAEESRDTKNGWQMVCHAAIWEITDAGRAALAAAANTPGPP
jgi:hypothetical protein